MTFLCILRHRESWTTQGLDSISTCLCTFVDSNAAVHFSCPLSCSFWLRFAWPWRKVPKNSVLDVTLEGEIPEKKGSRFSSTLSVSELCDALQKAAVDPRIRSVCVTVKPLSIGWGKVLEIRRHLQHFRSVKTHKQTEER